MRHDTESVWISVCQFDFSRKKALSGNWLIVA